MEDAGRSPTLLVKVTTAEVPVSLGMSMWGRNQPWMMG